MLRLHGNLGESKVGAHFDEGWERPLPLDQRRHIGEAVVEATESVEDERAVTNWLTKIGELIGHGLQTTAIVINRQITLDKCAKLGVEEECTGLLVPNELLFQCQPDNASCGRDVLAVHLHLEELGGDGAVQS
jgi:hypothetical protein